MFGKNIGDNIGEVFEPLVDLTGDPRDFAEPIWNQVSEDAGLAGKEIIAVFDDIANQIEGGVEALLNELDSLQQPIVYAIKEYFTAVKNLKDNHARILELNRQLKSSGLPLKDLMNSEQNRRCALELADKTLEHFQILNKIISLLKELCNFLGNDLKDQLRQCDPLLSKWLPLG